MVKRIEDLWLEAEGPSGINRPSPISLDFCPIRMGKKNRVHIVALGDVGATVLMGLRLLGGDVISEIGIWDLSKDNIKRLEREINQIRYPFDFTALPPVRGIEEEELYCCDLFVFCASKSVPPMGSSGDVRMAQLTSNRKMISHYGQLAKKAAFKGMVAVISDPVDPLCKAFLQSSLLHPAQIRGYGLGVMNARALYYSEKDSRFSHYAKQGRAFGPHGRDLVIADSVVNYNDALSKELTKLTVEANMEVRQMGFKPYIAPAFSSAAISILLTLRGRWHYSSLYLGDEKKGAFLGIKNRLTERGSEYEDLPLCESLFERIQKAYMNLYSMD